jgi:hypothetical protein
MGLQQAKDAGENRDGKVSQTDSVLLCVHEIPGTLSLSFFLSSLLPRVPRYLQSALVRVCSFHFFVRLYARGAPVLLFLAL